MALANRDTDRIDAEEVEVIPYRRTLRYPGVPDARLPEKPTTELRGSGFLGLGGNRQDQANERRLRELYHLGVEVAYAEEMAVGVEVKGIKAVTEGVSKAEQIVYSYPADTITGMVAADMTGEATARSRVRHGRLMEAYDAEAMNIIRRR